ncbi:MAG: FAD-binding oxidoreductase, partial [Acidimicrobiales bacterium]
SWPGAVARPTSTTQVAAALRVARELNVAVVAQGGRSGVEGGAAAPDGALALDLTAMSHVLDLDEVAMTVTVEAGCFGPELDAATRSRGLTVGHFPQSFDISTVGGWLACRGAGQYSNRYGTVADLVRSLTVVLADSSVVHVGSRAPRQAVGPDLVGLFVGSEGTLGVITEATLVMRPIPDAEARRAYRLADFDEGLDACRRIARRGASPAVLRLYDDAESRRSFDVEGCALIVIDEGDPRLVDATVAVVDDELRHHDALDTGLVERWLEHRNDVSALAGLWGAGVCVDTIEVAGSWSALPMIRHSVLDALRAQPETVLASVHQSHAYLDGACLYFTFAGRPDADPTDYYRRAWDVATRAALDHGASLSHHHGVGRNRARFVADALGDAFPLLVALKSTLDPEDLLNPGALGLGGPPW